MEVLFAVTKLAKAHNCDKYLQWAIRGWTTTLAYNICNDREPFWCNTFCLRCTWIRNLPSTEHPGVYTKIFIRQWNGCSP
jgi:hypothetical protein